MSKLSILYAGIGWYIIINQHKREDTRESVHLIRRYWAIKPHIGVYAGIYSLLRRLSFVYNPTIAVKAFTYSWVLVSLLLRLVVAIALRMYPLRGHA